MPTELKNIDLTNYSAAFDALKWPHKSSPLSRLMLNYQPSGSKKILIQNMGWIKRFLFYITDNLNTRSARMYRTQQWMIKIYPDKFKTLIKSTMILSKKEYTLKNKASTIARDEQSKLIFSITSADLLKIIEALKADNSVIANVFIIMMSTGKRKGEVLRAADIPERKGKSLIFKKLSKKTENVEAVYKTPFYHLTYPDLVTRWKKLREDIKDDIESKSDIEAGKLYQREIEETMNSLGLGSHGSHIFRKLYVAHSLQFKPRRWSSNVWIKKILAHDKSGGSAALHYNNLILGDKTDLIKPKKIRVIQSFVRDDLKREIIKMRADNVATTARAIKARGFGSSTYSRYYKSIVAELDAIT